MSFAPIILFVYNRLELTKQTIKFLQKNKLSKESELFIYSDGAKNQDDLEQVKAVRSYIKTITGFKNITIIEREKNWGLASSIIDGVTQVINKYGRVIVLEDDLVVSNDFLEYMNEVLHFYANDNKIWSISGYGPNLPCLKNYDKDVYLSVRGSSWGWATWQDRWQTIDWNTKEFYNLKKDKKLRKKFELAGNDVYKMLELQMLGKINSWGIRWYVAQFKQKKYTVYPKYSKIYNNGFNSLGSTHTTGNGYKWITDINNTKVVMEDILPNDYLLRCFKNYYDLSVFSKFGYFLKKYKGYNLIKKLLNYNK
jgi:hypothetical protein